ncbi:MAG: pyridoxal phosphate-dependent aminotransferase, partial [Polyangiales bacterium]
MSRKRERMLPPLEYLAWAIENYGQVRFDLASSGMPTIPAEAVGDPALLLSEVGDACAPRRWHEAIARRFHVDPAHAVPALGTTHGLWATYAALLSPGDDVVVETPVYEPLLRQAQGVGARVVPFARDIGRGAVIDPDVIGRAMTPKTKLVVVSNLHNPSGLRAPDATLAALATRVQARGAYLLVDEVYAPFDSFTTPDGTWSGSARRLDANVIAAGSLTKCYGLGAH